MRPHAGGPVFLDLAHIEMPVGALTSILHRISGIILAVSVPAVVYLLELSIRDERGFAQATELLTHRAFKTAAVLVFWAIAHHALAGARHMLTDIGVGSSLRAGRGSSWFVNLSALALALLAAGTMW